MNASLLACSWEHSPPLMHARMGACHTAPLNTSTRSSAFLSSSRPCQHQHCALLFWPCLCPKGLAGPLATTRFMPRHDGCRASCKHIPVPFSLCGLPEVLIERLPQETMPSSGSDNPAAAQWGECRSVSGRRAWRRRHAMRGCLPRANTSGSNAGKMAGREPLSFAQLNEHGLGQRPPQHGACA